MDGYYNEFLPAVFEESIKTSIEDFALVKKARGTQDSS